MSDRVCSEPSGFTTPLSSSPPLKKARLNSPSITVAVTPPPLLLQQPTIMEPGANPSAAQDTNGASERPISTVDYRNKACLAPMVRTGTLPTRLLALQYGCDLVWGPEIVDKAMIGTTRVVDQRTGLISYNRSDKLVWSTHPIEKPYLIYQIGTSDPELAVKAALTVQQDVSGVDLNCGCPKPFSTHSGMGAALLSTPDLLCSILRALVGALDVPVSCKIRLLPSQEDTLELVDRVCQTGIKCLTIHARTRNMRSSEKALMERLRDLVEVAEKYGIPVVANGDVGGMWDFEKIKRLTGVSSIMIARAAESNPSCFLPDRPLDTSTVVVPELVRIAYHFENPWGNTKFLLGQFSPSPSPLSVLSKTESKALRERGTRCKTIEDLAEVYGVSLKRVEDEEDLANEGDGGLGAIVLAKVRQGLERRRKERSDGVLPLGGETEKADVLGRGTEYVERDNDGKVLPVFKVLGENA
ncbi:trna-dihydrouridine synthase 2 [Phaffia rhodozyma]|uniref:Trna-dihydrouridine synthase 2 n=1 Tax=Phaffia rhodozyma TaxID=264483 RepID=A0A0F7SP21_PHARH|nr:trna-dihydrouridine synthase 2 [Phaffia rhodozyma]